MKSCQLYWMSKTSKEVGGLAKTHVLQGVEAKPTEIWGATITSEVISSCVFQLLWILFQSKVKLLHLKASTTEKEAQHLVGLFGFWRQYSPQLRIDLWQISF